MDITMATKFTISDSESEPSEEVEESETDQSWIEQNISNSQSLNIPLSNLTVKIPEASGRVRLNSESYSTISDTKIQVKGEGENRLAGDEAPFRGRSQSAPAALWAAKKYGRQLRRMSDEFDSLLDKGEIKRIRSAGTTRQMQHSKSWWNYLFSHEEIDGENSHHENSKQ